IDPRYFRPTEVEILKADITKAKKELGWSPTVKLSQLVRAMVDYDLMEIGIEPPGEGIEILESEKFSWTDNSVTKG
ncbi:unnamed protein product, partial [marine sediment metagenome]